MAETEASTSGAGPKQGDGSVLEEAKTLLVQGKRFIALEDYQSATDSLEQACQLFDAYYGVAKRECADAYLEYGLALVALANLEAGNGTDNIMKRAGIEGDEEDDEEGNDEEEGDDDDEEEGGEDEGEAEENTEEAKLENGKGAAPHTNGTATNGQSSKDPPASDASNGNSEPTPSEQTSSTSAGAAAAASSGQTEPKPGTSDGAASGGGQDDDEMAEDEEATTIEVAWEVLCLAKRLYMTDESLEGRLKLAETLQKIGEISIEWDNNDNAVSILEECLKIREAILPPDDRLIASTHYHLGLAHSFKSETQEANESFQKAIDVIEKRISSLQADLEKAKASQDTAAIGAYQKEINELKELLPDMTMRLDDSKEDGQKSTEVLKRTREEMQLEDEEAKKVCSDKSKPVDDISHLVKRKAT